MGKRSATWKGVFGKGLAAHGREESYWVMRPEGGRGKTEKIGTTFKSVEVSLCIEGGDCIEEAA